MFMVKQDFNFSSEPENGAIDKNAKGNRFAVRFQNNWMTIPTNAQNVELSVIRAAIYYNTPNVTEGVNNSFNISLTHPTEGFYSVLVDLPTGIYTVANIQDAVFNTFNAATIALNPLADWTGIVPPPFLIELDDRVLKFVITLDPAYDPTTVDFNVANSFGPFIGFGNTTLVGFGPSAYVFPAQDEAKVNNVNGYMIHSDLVQGGLLTNGVSSQTIAVVPILVQKHGELINFLPRIPTITQAPHLVGYSTRDVKLWLTDEKNQDVDTQKEDWRFILRISWWQPYNSKVIKQT